MDKPLSTFRKLKQTTKQTASSKNLHIGANVKSEKKFNEPPKIQTLSSDLIEVPCQSVHLTRDTSEDAKFYGTNQDNFTKESHKFVDELAKMIADKSTQPSDFKMITELIKEKRSDLSGFQPMSSPYRHRNSDDCLFQTTLGSYYGERFKVVLENIKNEPENITEVENMLKDIDMFKDNTHQTFRPVYKKNSDIALTRTYISHGTKIAAPSVGCANPEFQAYGGHMGNVGDYPEHFDKDFSSLKEVMEESIIIKKINRLKQENISVQNKEFRKLYIDNQTPNILLKHDDGTITDGALLHARGDKIDENLTEIDKEYQEYKKNKENNNTKEAFENVCNMVYLFAHTCPFTRGSAWGAEVIASSFFKDLLKNDKINFVKSDLDFQCFSQSSDKFIDYMRKTLL